LTECGDPAVRLAIAAPPQPCPSSPLT
jgi:hypothetical protein